jgi:hypothetical protein
MVKMLFIRKISGESIKSHLEAYKDYVKNNSHIFTIFYVLNAYKYYTKRTVPDKREQKTILGSILIEMLHYKNSFILSHTPNNSSYIITMKCDWKFLLTRNRLVSMQSPNATIDKTAGRITFKHNIDIYYEVEKLFYIQVRQAQFQGINEYNNGLYTVINYSPSSDVKFITMNADAMAGNMTVVTNESLAGRVNYMTPWINESKSVPNNRLGLYTSDTVNEPLKVYNNIFNNKVQEYYTSRRKVRPIHATGIKVTNDVIVKEYVDEVIAMQNNLYSLIEKNTLTLDTVRECVTRDIENITQKSELSIKARFMPYFLNYKRYVIYKITNDITDDITRLMLAGGIDHKQLYANIKLLLDKNDNLVTVLMNYNGRLKINT